MPGRWLTAVARRLTDAATFEHIVAPAVADLQSESARARLRALRHYPGIVAVLIFAVMHDAYASNRLTWRLILRGLWKKAAMWHLAVTLLIASWIWWNSTPWHWLGPLGRVIAVVITMMSAIIVTIPLVVAAVSFHLKRDAAGNRSALLSLVAVYVVVTMLLAGCLTRVQSDLEVMMFRSMPIAVWGNQASSDAAWSGMQEWRAANQLSIQIRQSFEGPLQHLSVPNAIYVVIFATSHGITLMMLALAGGALARVDGIKVLARALTIGVLYVVLLQVLPHIESGLPFPYRLIAFDLDQVVMLAALWWLANHAAVPGLKPRPTPA